MGLLALNQGQAFGFPGGDATGQTLHPLKAGAVQNLAGSPRMLTHLTHQYHRLVLVRVEFGQIVLQFAERNITGTGNMSFTVIFLLPDIQYQRIIAVDQVGELLRGDRLAAATGFQHKEQHQQHR